MKAAIRERVGTITPFYTTYYFKADGRKSSTSLRWVLAQISPMSPSIWARAVHRVPPCADGGDIFPTRQYLVATSTAGYFSTRRELRLFRSTRQRRSQFTNYGPNCPIYGLI